MDSQHPCPPRGVTLLPPRPHFNARLWVDGFPLWSPSSFFFVQMQLCVMNWKTRSSRGRVEKGKKEVQYFSRTARQHGQVYKKVTIRIPILIDAFFTYCSLLSLGCTWAFLCWEKMHYISANLCWVYKKSSFTWLGCNSHDFWHLLDETKGRKKYYVELVGKGHALTK